jgi:hypothetical protein
MRRSILSAIATLVVALPFASASADATPTSVDQLSATAGASGIAVSGSATFVDVPVSATDATGDSTPAGGTDLKTATISAPQVGKLRFQLTLNDALPQLSSAPASVYLWPLTINGESTGLNLHASRLQAGTAPSTPRLRVVTVLSGSITTVADVPGSMADGVIEWNVPLSTIGAAPGSEITSDAAITEVVGTAGVGTVNQNYDDMSAPDIYVVPGRIVQLGIGPATAADDAIALTTSATAAANGTFTKTLPTPSSPGQYRIVAQACFGPLSCSVVRSVIVTV